MSPRRISPTRSRPTAAHRISPRRLSCRTIGSDNSFQNELSSALGNTDSNPEAGGVQVEGVVNENVPAQLVYDPSNPQANAKGYVSEPNIQPVTEMTNLISESNDYQANVTAMDTTKQMYSSTLQLLR